MVAAALPVADRTRVRVVTRGAATAVRLCRDPEVLLDGPAGTGKTVGALWKIHACLLKYPGAKALVVRKTAASLGASTMQTYTRHVLRSGNFGVAYYGGSRVEPPAFRYPNGSRLVVGGMDDPAKIMSTEYDLAFVNEAIDLELGDWEDITTRLRHGVMPYQQIIGDCNPDTPTHWLNLRCQSGVTTRLLSRHEDNPRYVRADGTATEEGRVYIARLDALTGVRKQRRRYGKWVAAEGQVFDAWDDSVHLIDRAELPPESSLSFVGSADWGWTNPGVLHVWGEDGDGRAYLVAEHYHTERTVEGWWAPRAAELTERYGVSAWHCDPSEPQNIAVFEAAGLRCVGAINDILPGIDAVQERLRPAGDGRPRLFVVKDCLIEQDEKLAGDGRGLPWSTVQEIPRYVWKKNAAGVASKELPIDLLNHGMDTMRYGIMALAVPPPRSGLHRWPR